MFFDTWAWVEYFEGSEAGEHVRELLDGEPVVYTSPMVLAEVRSKYGRLVDAEDGRERVDFVLRNTALIDHDEEIGRDAGRIHAEQKEQDSSFGMADAFVLAAARSRGVSVLTGDPHFEGLEDGLMLDVDR